MKENSICITLYPHRLTLVSIPRDKIEQICHPLLNFFVQNSNTQFFSLTTSKTEISLVIQEKASYKFSSFPQKPGWFALEVGMGAENSEGDLVQATSSVLADAEIPIYYMSSFSDDFILVEEKNLEAAINSLSQAFTVEADLEQIKKGSPKNASPVLTEKAKRSSLEEHRGVKFELRVLEEELMMISLKKEEKHLYLEKLLELLFYTCNEDYMEKKNERFVNYTQTEQTVSILLDQKSYVQVFGDGDSSSSHIKYSAIQRFGKKGFNEVGVINYLSTSLVQEKVPTLYLSTYTDAFMLVLKSDLEKAVNLLQKTDNIVVLSIQVPSYENCENK